MQPGDAIVMTDAGIVVLQRPGAPVRQVDQYETLRAWTPANPGEITFPMVVIIAPDLAALTPDARDALTALRDMLADDATSLTMRGGRDADLGAYAGEIAARLTKVLGA